MKGTIGLEGAIQKKLSAPDYWQVYILAVTTGEETAISLLVSDRGGRRLLEKAQEAHPDAIIGLEWVEGIPCVYDIFGM